MNRNYHKISVLVPVYGTERYIERCARSLFNQTLKDVEYIFVDDCTIDNSMEILNEVLNEFPNIDCKVFHHNENKGLSSAHLTAMNEAKGDFWICCDSDDWVETDYLEKLYNKAIAENADIVCCNYIEEWNTNQVKRSYSYKKETKDDILNPLHVGGIYCALWNKLIKSSIYKENSIFPWEGINAWEDSFLTIRLRLYSKNTIIIDDYLYHYNCQNSDGMTRRYSLKTYSERIEGTKHMIDFFYRYHYDFDSHRLINYMKVKSKLGLLFSEDTEAVKIWKENFPETKMLIWHHPLISLPEKVLGYLLSICPMSICLCLLKLAHKLSDHKFC